MVKLILLALVLSGCGQPGSLCSLHGGVSFIDQGFIYCDDGTYFKVVNRG